MWGIYTHIESCLLVVTVNEYLSYSNDLCVNHMPVISKNNSEEVHIWETKQSATSLMGHFCYNVLCIDIFFIITNGIQMFNYADDITIMCQDKSQNNVFKCLQDMANKMTNWFTNNSMTINPDKFNAIMFV